MQDSKYSLKACYLKMQVISMLKNIYIIQIILIGMCQFYRIPIADFCSQYHGLEVESINMLPAKRADI